MNKIEFNCDNCNKKCIRPNWEYKQTIHYWVTKEINRLKWDLSQQKLLNLITQIYKHSVIPNNNYLEGLTSGYV